MHRRRLIPLLIAGKLALLGALALPPLGSAETPATATDFTTATATFQPASGGDDSAIGTFLALPSMFHRGERGRRLLDEVMTHPVYPATPATFQDAARKIAAKAAP
ncbi:hypothetical protein [uncultured Sphaerotilus sp.]|uniref:hypothetical protein n=1 Tax=uncultured Sphaerotilus sp. TaxID=474984 RepID=UPI0030CA375E